MDFKKLTENDFDNIFSKINESKYYENYISSEYTPLFLLTWGSDYEIAYDEDDIFIKGFHKKTMFLPPISKDLEKAYKKINDNFNDYYYYGITDELNLIGATHMRDLDEYIYDNSLLTLKGKALHKKRNLLNQFLKNNYTFKSYDQSDYDNIIELFYKWDINNEFEYELDKIKLSLNYIDKYSFCDCLYLNEKLVAFSIGCTCNNVGYCFFEKADSNIKGAYQAINYLTANKHFKNVSLINRQEDIGIESLRYAKLSYNPVMLLKKYKKSYL